MAGVSSGRAKWDVLPEGVRFIRRYATSGVLVECDHANEHQRPTGGWAIFQDGELVETKSGESSEREVRESMTDYETLDYGGWLRCIICGGDETTTDCFQRPVKLFVDVPDPKPTQVGLF